MAKSKFILSAATLGVITECINTRLAYARETHDRGVGFGANEKFFVNVADYTSKLLKARNEMGIIFEQQFEK